LQHQQKPFEENEHSSKGFLSVRFYILVAKDHQNIEVLRVKIVKIQILKILNTTKFRH
jgi:hypothetical protein